MKVDKCNVGIALGLVSGIFGIWASSLSVTKFAGVLFEYAGLLLAYMISLSAIIGTILTLKQRLIVGGYLMVFTSLIWMLSWPLMIILPTPATGTILGMIGGAMFILMAIAGPWPVLSFVGGILILSAGKKTLVNTDKVNT